ncbi:hypothetical protein [Lacunimicrobium album]
MRLTLRTLLAYLDDVLGPDQTREIGAKVDESNVAKSLMARLKEVIRKRRVLAPAVDTRDEFSDANAISQYLDNTLPSEKIANVEKRALESDEVLAEVASCHQILTLVLGNPAHVSEQTRNKMYALVDSKVPKAVPAPTAGASQPAAAAAVPVSSAKRPSASELEAIGAGSGFYRMAELLGDPIDTGPHEVPQYLKKSNNRGNVLIGLGVAALLLIWVASIAGDPALDWFKKNTTTLASNDQPGEAAAPATGDKKPAPVLPPPKEPTSTIVATDPKASSVADMTPVAIVETPLSVPGTSTTVEMTNVISVPSTSTGPAVAMNDPNMAAPKIETPAPTIPPGVPESPPADPNRPLARYTFVSSEELLLCQMNIDGSPVWQVMPAGAVLQEGQMIAVPKPFRAELVGPDPLAGVTLDGASLLTLNGTADQTSLSMTLTQGRLIFSHKGTAEADKPSKPVRIGIAMQKDNWTIELIEPGTVCGVEMVPRSPVSFEEDFRGVGYYARVILKSGKVRVLSGDEPVAIIEGGTSVIKTWEGADKPSLSQVVGNMLGLVADGSWVDESIDRRTQTQRSYATRYFRSFTPNTDATNTLTGIATDRDARMSEYATLTLGLTRNTRELVNILANGTHQEAREDAIGCLRLWMNENIVNRLELKEDLADYFPEGTADIVYRLLWGVSKQEASSSITSRQLIELLGHENVAVRHLVIDQLKNLTGKNYEYRAEDSKALREKSVARWIEHLMKEGAILTIPKDSTSAPVISTPVGSAPATPAPEAP